MCMCKENCQSERSGKEIRERIREIAVKSGERKEKDRQREGRNSEKKRVECLW